MGSWGKGRAERSQVVLIRVVKAHKCPPGPEVGPPGARLQPGACPGAEPCQELRGRAQQPGCHSPLWPGAPVWAGVSEGPVLDGKQTLCAGGGERKTGVTANPFS